uniref:CAZy families GH32 protein n=1 Tax=uncultured Geobacillus sp. TaxID=228952 RepID=A0A060BS41_9BACL|nr:CAZy families GH32 protein [uncultured Geobacillus sp.]
MPDVVALGEILIDFTPFKTKDGNSNIFEKNPGGAPANFLAILSELGISTAFIGKAGG